MKTFAKVLPDRFFVVGKINPRWPIGINKRERDLLNKSYPVGCIINFAYKKETDSQLEKRGFLACKGQEYDIKKFSELYKIIGKEWGNKVIDLTARVIKK